MTSGPFHDLSLDKIQPAALAELQASRLQSLLQTVLATNRFYKARFKSALKGTEPAKLSLQDLPLTSRADLLNDQARHAPFGTNYSQPVSDYIRFHQGGGDSGGKVRWVDTAESWDWMLRNLSWAFSAAGIKTKDRVCFAFPFGPELSFWAAFEAAARYGTLCFPTGGMSHTARLRFMLDNGSTVLCCTPTAALRMAEAAVKEKVNIALSPVRLLFLLGEFGGSMPKLRAQLEEAWGARCVDHYALTEAGPVVFECEKTKGRLHVIETEYIAECIDPVTGKASADGQPGELVLTTLGRAASPAIRYRTGDCVRLIRPAPCACGRHLAALEGGILGRVDQVLAGAGGAVYPSTIEDLIRGYPEISEFRVEIDGPNEAKLFIEASGEPHEVAAVSRTLAAELQRLLGWRAPVELAAPGSLPRFEMRSRRWVKA
ncbi:MAG TPA: AMP-binding protein [Planctomycetota bacterium]|jgi:phenylacetate-CoA ligase